MANVDKPNGFKPVGTLSGAPWTAFIERFELDGSSNDVTIAVGDLVGMTATGYLNRIKTATTTSVRGVVVGVDTYGATTVGGIQGDNMLSSSDPTLSGAGANRIAASTAGTIYVCTAPDLIMVAQEDADTDPLELADVGQNVAVLDANAHATTGLSQGEIDSSSHNTTNTLPLKLIGLAQEPGNELGDTAAAASRPQTARWLVTFANHEYSGLNLGV